MTRISRQSIRRHSISFFCICNVATLGPIACVGETLEDESPAGSGTGGSTGSGSEMGSSSATGSSTVTGDGGTTGTETGVGTDSATASSTVTSDGGTTGTGTGTGSETGSSSVTDDGDSTGTDSESGEGSSTSEESGETGSTSTTEGDSGETDSSDSTGDEPSAAVSGVVTRSVEPSDGNDAIGTLYVSVMSSCNATAKIISWTKVDKADLSAADAEQPFLIEKIPNGKFYVSGYLDDNENAAMDKPLPDKGDLIPANGIILKCLEVTVADSDVSGLVLDLNLAFPI